MVRVCVCVCGCACVYVRARARLHARVAFVQRDSQCAHIRPGLCQRSVEGRRRSAGAVGGIQRRSWGPSARDPERREGKRCGFLERAFNGAEKGTSAFSGSLEGALKKSRLFRMGVQRLRKGHVCVFGGSRGRPEEEAIVSEGVQRRRKGHVCVLGASRGL